MLQVIEFSLNVQSSTAKVPAIRLGVISDKLQRTRPFIGDLEESALDIDLSIVKATDVGLIESSSCHALANVPFSRLLQDKKTNE